MMKRSTKIWLTTIGMLIVVVAIGFLWPVSDRRIHNPVILESARAGWMRNAIWEYARTHDDTFPKVLSDLQLGSIPLEARHFHDPRNKREEDWIYYPGYGLDSSPETIILASPREVDTHKRITVFVEGSVQIMDEDDFVGFLSRQLNSKLLPLPLLATNEPPADAPELMPDSSDRVADARGRCGAHLAQIFAAAGLTYPARAVYLRVFKQEGQLELWARSEPVAAFRLVQTYPVLCASGRLGPKRREGDQQVPEGFYTVDRFNPRSLFHLSIGLDYPNAADRLLTTDPEHPGTDIFIHGSAVSVGCMAMGDAVAEEIYLAATDARAIGGDGPTVHIFPCRMTLANWRDLLAPLCAGRPDLGTLWRSLRAGYDHFERDHRLPTVRVNTRGQYVVD